jgi:glyoxylase-like metal-dependent hydrolase (beta-lactamase superfamily II)
MKDLIRIDDFTHRLTTPYKDIFTTVYTIKLDDGVLLFDAASFDTDAEEYILPMLKELSIAPENVKYVFISHNHKDHSGGLGALLPHLPNATVITPSDSIKELYPDRSFLSPAHGETVADTFTFVSIKGHTADSCALLDRRTNTLITGDCLQLYGIFGSQDWGSNIPFAGEYLAALTPLYSLGAEEVHTAHDFHPYGICYIGKDAIRSALDACREPIMNICALIKANPDKSDAELREIYNASANIPPVREGVFRLMREEIREGKL